MRHYNKILLIILLILIFNCNKAKREEKNVNIKKEHLQTINDTLYISENLVMYITLDTQKIDNLKQIYGKEFFTIMDDESYYKHEVTKYIKSKHIRTFDVSQKIIAYFFNDDYVFYSLDSMKSPLNILLYKRNKTIMEVVPIDIDLEFEKYYEN